jgi:hypothetical protein
VCVGIDDNDEHCSSTTSLAFALLAHHFDPNEPLPHEVLLSMAKLMGEGRFQEIKTVLGCILYNMHLFVSLYYDNPTLWSADLRLHISHGTLPASELDNLVGCPNHMGYLTPLMCHFLGRIYSLTDDIVSYDRRSFCSNIMMIYP